MKNTGLKEIENGPGGEKELVWERWIKNEKGGMLGCMQIEDS